MPKSLAWGLRVSPAFRDRVFWIQDQLDIAGDNLMAAMAFESGETFRADIRNAAGSGAVGLIQFMPSTAKNLGTSTESLAKMSPEDQLNYVFKYFKPYRGRLRTLSDVYMAILWPRAVGQPESYPLFVRGRAPLANYQQNAGLDTNKDGVITKAEAAAKVQAKLLKGMTPDRLWRA